jgi:hypothetical protein
MLFLVGILPVLLASCKSTEDAPKTTKIGAIVEYRGEVETDADPQSATIVLRIDRKKSRWKYDPENPSDREFLGGHPFIAAENRSFTVQFFPVPGPEGMVVTGEFASDASGMLPIRLPAEVVDFGSEGRGCRLVLTSIEEAPLTPKRVEFPEGPPSIDKETLGRIYLEHGGSSK